jgi:hypothetical protein
MVGWPEKQVARKLSVGCSWRGGGGSVPAALHAAASLLLLLALVPWGGGHDHRARQPQESRHRLARR